MTTKRTQNIIEKNMKTLSEFFKKTASCEYYDGLSYQLYLDTNDDTLKISQQISNNDYLQRDDGSLIQIHRISGYCDIPKNERYTDEYDLSDYGFDDWITIIEDEIETAINT